MRIALIAGLIGLGCSLACGTVSAASAPVMDEPVLATRVDGNVDIGLDGRVTAYTLTSKLPEPLATRVHDMVMRFRFEPVVMDGKPVLARARMRLGLAASPTADGGMRVTAEHIGFPHDPSNPVGAESEPGDDTIEVKTVRHVVPLYPVSALRAGISGRVLVAVHLDENGNVLDVIAQQSALFNAKGSPRAIAPLLAEFESASVRAVRSWRFSVAAGGKKPDADALTGLIPVVFTIDRQSPMAPGVWTWELRTHAKPLPWRSDRLAGDLPNVDEVGVDGEFGLRPTRYRVVDDAGRAL